MSGIIGLISVSAAVPGSSEVKTFLTDLDPGTSGDTIITPASGKRLRISSVSWQQKNTGTASNAFVYFGTGATAYTTPDNIVSGFAFFTSTADNKVDPFPDGGGPVGNVDEVLTYYHEDAGGENIRLIIRFREE